MLFTGQVREEAYGIFEDYRSLGGDGLVARAYLTWMSWQDFVRDERVPEGLYGYLEQAIAWEAGLAPVCELSYLRYLSGKRKLSEAEELRAERMTKVCIQKKLRFCFMKPLLARLGRSELLEDKTFVEYRANPEHKVILHYVIESPRMKNCNYVAERLYPVEPGLFVKEFTLFYGDHLKYQVIEEWNQKTKESEMLEKNYQDINLSRSSRYDLLNQMSKAFLEKNLEDAEFAVLQFKEQEALADHIFKLL